MQLLTIFVLLVASACVCDGKFIMINGTFTFTEAQEQCEGRGMKLASIQGYADQLEAKKATKRSKHPGCEAYTPNVTNGCRVYINLKLIEGEFHPIGGKSKFRFWLTGKPDNVDGNETCVEMNYSGDEAGWNDIPCHERISALCDKSYIFVMINGTFKFYQAEQVCEKHGMKFAFIFSSREQLEARNATLISDHPGCYSNPGQIGCRVWIFLSLFGLYDFWPIHGRSTFTFWKSGEPNNLGGNENCAEMHNFGHTGEWNDLSCQERLSALCEETSVADGKPVRQRDTVNNGHPSRAVDGNRNVNHFTGHSCTQTSATNGTHFWTVDLEGNFHIGKITITIPQDCCRANFAGVEVFVSNDSAITTFGHDDKRCAAFDGPPKEGETTITLSCGGELGRHVSILKRNGSLSMCEVHIRAIPPGFQKIPTESDNLAVGRPAQQSSTADDGVASRAVDGNRNGNSSIGQSCTQTSGNGPHSWSVDLQRTVNVRKVKITIPQDCCREELKNLKVFVTDAGPVKAGDNVDEIIHLCDSFHGPPYQEETTINMECPDISGRFVSVVQSPHGELSMCEVEVFGTEGSQIPIPGNGGSDGDDAGIGIGIGGSDGDDAGIGIGR